MRRVLFVLTLLTILIWSNMAVSASVQHNEVNQDFSWIPDASGYTSDSETYSASYPAVGRKVTYYYSNTYQHSGIVTVNGPTVDTITIESKWGYLGLFSHSVVDCPYYAPASSISYWKRN